MKPTSPEQNQLNLATGIVPTCHSEERGRVHVMTATWFFHSGMVMYVHASSAHKEIQAGCADCFMHLSMPCAVSLRHHNCTPDSPCASHLLP